MSATSGEAVTVFVNAALVPMTADIAVPDQRVVVAYDRIIGIGSSSEVTVPDGAVVIDGQGAYVMPGLADMHVHLSDDPKRRLELRVSSACRARPSCPRQSSPGKSPLKH